MAVFDCQYCANITFTQSVSTVALTVRYCDLPEEVNVHNLFVRIQCRAQDFVSEAHTCIVDQYVHPAVKVDTLLCHSRNAVMISEIKKNCSNPVLGNLRTKQQVKVYFSNSTSHIFH